MLFCQDKNEMNISLFEFVSTARRGICTTLPLDDDEPAIKSASDRARRSILGNTSEDIITTDFYVGDVRFVLEGKCDSIEKDSITIIRVTDVPPDRITKAEMAQCRAEAFVLGYIHANNNNLKSVNLTIIIASSVSDNTREVSERVGFLKLKKFFDKCVCAVSIYSRVQLDRVKFRLPSMRDTRFPFENVRSGQSEFVKSVYRAIGRGDALFASAPTGTGKTISTLFPAIRALGNGLCQKVFYLTVKSMTALAARDCLKLMREKGCNTRAIILTAKEKCCKLKLICRDARELCPLTKFNRLADAVMELYDLDITVVEEGHVQEISRKYHVCPHELMLTYSELCDVVICDINYLFDPSVYIRRFFTHGGDYVFLVDEAHNLPDRIREMYSCEVSLAELEKTAFSDLLTPLSPLAQNLRSTVDMLNELLMPYINDYIFTDKDGKRMGATHISDVPCEIYDIFASLTECAEGELMKCRMARDADAAMRLKLVSGLLYNLKKINYILSLFDTSYKMFITYSDDNLKFKLFCLDTSDIVKKCISKGKSAVFFSATLEPIEYYKSLLGGNNADTISIQSPFNPEQLCVSIIDSISTRYSERERTLDSVCRVIAATLSAKRGNYMIFSPSFEYSRALYERFSQKHPKIKSLYQSSGMSEAEKNEFLDAFKEENPNYLVGFCVMGGIYSEGIDLVGDSLIGAVVIGIGMPSLSYEREAIAEYFEEKYESGKQYAYVYPGMNRVFQAAGRVIRRENDRGVIVLIDDRFRDPIYKKSIPSLWRGMGYISDAKALNERLAEFWREDD